MAIIDNDLRLSNAQAVTTVATHASTNYIDMQAAASNLSSDLELIIRVNTACTSTGSATVLATVESDDNTSFSSALALAATGAVAVASLSAGYEFLRLRLPVKGTADTLERYLRVTYTIGSVALTAGKFDAYLVTAGDLNTK